MRFSSIDYFEWKRRRSLTSVWCVCIVIGLLTTNPNHKPLPHCIKIFAIKPLTSSAKKEKKIRASRLQQASPCLKHLQWTYYYPCALFHDHWYALFFWDLSGVRSSFPAPEPNGIDNWSQLAATWQSLGGTRPNCVLSIPQSPTGENNSGNRLSLFIYFLVDLLNIGVIGCVLAISRRS